jgi:hypothetical protein
MSSDFLVRASSRTGFVREAYVEKRLPERLDDITITPFFGDGVSEFALSTMLHRRVKEQFLRDRYWIVATHPGRAAMYPFADEVWGLKGEEVSKPILLEACGFTPFGKTVKHINQELNKFFETIYEPSEFLKLYDRGLKRNFFEKFGTVEVDLPTVSSPSHTFNKTLVEKPGFKVFVSPVRKLSVMDHQGRSTLTDVSMNFWVDLGEMLLSESITPVFQFGSSCYDLSTHFVARAVYCTETSINGVMAAMRATGCVLSLFQDNVFLAAMARTPFVWYEDRRRYNTMRFDELETIVFPAVPRQMGYSFPGAVTSGNHWEVIKAVVNKITGFLPTIDRDKLPATLACHLSPDYKTVRERKAKSIGTRLFRVPKLED